MSKMTTLREDVPPPLRFALLPEAMAEAEDMRREIVDRIVWSNIADDRRVDFVERVLVSRLSERWPLVARADEAVGGLLTDVLRVFAENSKIPGWWQMPLHALAQGHPDRLRHNCELVLGIEPAGKLEAHPEERGDRVLREAVRHWQDTDSADAELIETEA